MSFPSKQKQAFSNNVSIKIQVTSLPASTVHTVWQGEAHGSTLLLNLAGAEEHLLICRAPSPPVASSRYSCFATHIPAANNKAP